MNIGLKFRDLFSGRLGQAIINELDNILSGIIAHWEVEHNEDGTHANVTATGVEVDGDITATGNITAEAFYGPGIGVTDIPETSIADGSLLSRNGGNETVTGAWTFSTLPVLSTLTGYLKGTAGAVSAQSTPLPVGDLGTGTPDNTKFLRGDGAWAVPPGGGISDGDKGDITVSGSGATWTIDDDVVTNAKLAEVATQTLKGRKTAGTGNPEDFKISDLTAEASPAAGDYLLLEESGGNLRKVDWGSLPGAGAGEANTASNIGTAGVGVYDSKSGVDLRFRKINAGSSKITVALDAPNTEVDIDVAEANLTLNNIGGTLGLSKGGTNADLSATGPGYLKQASAGAAVTVGSIAAGDLPTHNHAAADINSGTIATARLGSGSASATTYLRGDQTWATPDTPQHEWMRPVGSGALSGAITCADGTCYAVCVGRLPAAATSVLVSLNVTSAMAGTVTYAEVGIGKSSAPAGSVPNITFVGYTDVSTVINGTGNKQITVNVSGGQTLARGDYLWVLLSQSATSTNPAIGGIVDTSLSGFMGSKATTQISTNIGSAIGTWTTTPINTYTINAPALPS